jgi:hypothetical protein
MIEEFENLIPNIINIIWFMLPLLIIAAIVSAVIGLAYQIAVWKGWIPRKRMNDPKI